MSNCEMCGLRPASVRAEVEGTELQVCKSCARYGKFLGGFKKDYGIRNDAPVEKKGKKEGPLELIVPDFSRRIREKRESLGMKQEEFAKHLSEKESIIHKIETGTFEPSLEMARNLEKKLGIKLVEEYKEEFKKTAKSEREVITLGDFIKIKKKD